MKNIIITILSLVLLFIAWNSLAPIHNMKVLGEVEILNQDKVVYTGGLLHYKFSYKKYLDIPGVVHKHLYISINNGAYSILYKPFVGHLPAGTHTITAHIDIPNTKFVVGPARLEIHSKYYILGKIYTLDDEVNIGRFEIREGKYAK